MAHLDAADDLARSGVVGDHFVGAFAQGEEARAILGDGQFDGRGKARGAGAVCGRRQPDARRQRERQAEARRLMASFSSIVIMRSTGGFSSTC